MARRWCLPPWPADRRGRRRFLPADLRLSRADGRGRQVSRRLPQAGRPPDDEGNAHRAADGPARSGRCFPPGSTTKCRSRLCAGQRPAERRRRAGHERRLGRAGPFAVAVPGPDRLGAAGTRRRPNSCPFPTQDELEESDLDLIVSGSDDAVLMIEGFAREMPEDQMLEALGEAHRIIKEILRLARSSCATKANVEKTQYDAAGRRRSVRQPQSGAITRPSKRPSRPTGKQARADAVAELKDKCRGRDDSRSGGRGCDFGRSLSARPGTNWKSTSSAT